MEIKYWIFGYYSARLRWTEYWTLVTEYFYTFRWKYSVWTNMFASFFANFSGIKIAIFFEILNRFILMLECRNFTFMSNTCTKKLNSISLLLLFFKAKITSTKWCQVWRFRWHNKWIITHYRCNAFRKKMKTQFN